MSITFTRSLLYKFVLPKPGQGPTRQQMKEGRMRNRIIAEADIPTTDLAALGGKRPRVTAILATPSDPGYSFTAVMIGQCAVLLATGKYKLRYATFSSSSLILSVLLQ